MKYKINEKEYQVTIVRKNNRHTYLRVQDNNVIKVTTNYFVTQHMIEQLLKQNHQELLHMCNKKDKELDEESNFYYLGREYHIVIVPTSDNIEIDYPRIYVKNLNVLNKWYQNEQKKIFEEHLKYQYSRFRETIPYPQLKIRTMKTRWGVCNRKNISVTLNSKLISTPIEYLDYVIVHELSHFVHFDHSKEFWHTVSQYCSNYKEIRKKMRE